jgi:hypothetical protein
MPVSCNSQRILNPFRGAMNIISTGGAEGKRSGIIRRADVFALPKSHQSKNNQRRTR